MERAERFVASELFGRIARGGARGFEVEMDEGVEFQLECGDAREMGFEKFDWRELLRAEERRDFREGSEMEHGHKEFREYGRATGASS